jgi:MFS family permease
VAAVFFTNGALFANVVPRYPEIKAKLGMSNAAFGSALAAFPFGALLAGLFAAALIRRFRSARVASFGTVVLAAAIALVGLAGNWPMLAVVFFAAGASDAILDVAQNAHGLRVQRLYGRSIVNSFHAVWSIGGVTGGLLGAAAAGSGIAVPVHLVGSSLLFSAVSVAAARFLLPGPDVAEEFLDAHDREGHDREGLAEKPVGSEGGRQGGLRPAIPILAALGVLAVCGAVIEDAAYSWSSLYMRSLGAAAATAGLAFVVFQVAMTGGRLIGDRLIDRFGQATVIRAGGALSAIGMGTGLALATTRSALVGYGLAGLGAAAVVPAVMHTANELPGLPHGIGLTVVSWLLRVGFLVSSPIVGLVADAASLRLGLLSVVVAGTTCVIFGRVLPNSRTDRTKVRPT